MISTIWFIRFILSFKLRVCTEDQRPKLFELCKKKKNAFSSYMTIIIITINYEVTLWFSVACGPHCITVKLHKKTCLCSRVIYRVIMKKDSLTEIMLPPEKQFSRRTLLAPLKQPKYIWKERFLLGRNNDWVGQKAWPPSARSYKRTDCAKAP